MQLPHEVSDDAPLRSADEIPARVTPVWGRVAALAQEWLASPDLTARKYGELLQDALEGMDIPEQSGR
ncbi:hypothetical protein [Rhodococcus qingshengii]|uniref:hypothetical protein n=1 Tax=Rhodococcus qingshengii TaxID=334542 RepID=UPI0035E10E96